MPPQLIWAGLPKASRSIRHGDFDDDTPTVEATLARILGRIDAPTTLAFRASGQRRRSVRRRLDAAAGLR